MSSPIATLSPSRLAKLACPARVAFDQAAPFGRGSSSGEAAAIGSVVHAALEAAVGGAGFDRAWVAACKEAQEGGLDVESMPSVRRVAHRCRRRAEELQEFLGSFNGYVPHPEVRLVSADGAIEGTPDLVVELSDGLVVVDYKSGLVTGVDGVKADYETQVRIYAGLAKERYAKPVVRGLLVSLMEGFVDVDVAPHAIEAERSRARAARAAYNAEVPGDQPAVPSPVTCQWCPHKARCDAFWTAVDETWRETLGGRVIEGQVTAAESSANGLVAFTLATRLSDEFVIAGVPEALATDAGPGRSIRATGLWVRADYEHVLNWGNASLISVGP